MPSMEDAIVPDVAAVAEGQVVAGQLMWGSGDSPWVHSVDEGKFAATLKSVLSLDPSMILSTHIPAIHGNVERHRARDSYPDSRARDPSDQRVRDPDVGLSYPRRHLHYPGPR